MDDELPERAGLRLLGAVVALAVVIGLLSLGAVLLLTRDPANAPVPHDAPPGLERAAERACVLGYRRVGPETSHIVAIVEQAPGQYEVRCAYGPVDVPSWNVRISCFGTVWTGPKGAGPNGSSGPYAIPCSPGSG